VTAALKLSEMIQNEKGAARMIWLPVDSKMFTSVAHDADEQTLYLRFQSGDVYCYFEFQAADLQAFLDAESHGRFFLAHIRDRFRYERMAKLRAA
jgi:KTSC domain